MDERGGCQRCGAPITTDEGSPPLCPACLLALATWAPRVTDLGVREPLLPHLVVLNLLGEGPRSRAYLAEWKPPGGGFAVIKCRKEGVSRAPLEADLERLLTLDHPRVAAVYDAGVDPHGRAYAITEYTPGLPITRYCDQAQLPAAARVELLLQAAEALEYAHALGLAHRNLKPSNVLVLPGQPSTVQVLDFEAAMPRIESDGLAPLDPVVSLSVAAGDDVRGLGILLAALLTPQAGEHPRLESIARHAAQPTGDPYPSLGALVADLATWYRASV